METHDLNKTHFKFGIFYYDKEDKRLFVPKRNPNMGVTVNFAHPKSRWFIVGLLIFVGILIIPFFFH